MGKILVTGGSGFIGGHAIVQLLGLGHEVRATVRDLTREADVRAMLKIGGVASAERLSFAAANLMDDAGWAEAVAGCDYVLHIASPFPTGVPHHEDEVIVPAREGALRVLRAARDAGAKRVVLTSSFAAIGYGHPRQTAPFDETDWTDLAAPGLSAYVKSKTLAERAAWDFVAREGGALELSVVNPVGVFGPVLGPDHSTSIVLLKRMLEGALAGCPRMYFGIVDVRDVVDLHIRAMTHPAAAGERFLAIAGEVMSVREIALALKARLGPAARKVPTLPLPDWLVRLGAIFDPAIRSIASEVGNRKGATSAKAQRLLGWLPRPREEALAATAESLIALGLLDTAPARAA